MPNFGGRASGFSSVAKQELAQTDLGRSEELEALDARDQDDPDGGEHGDDGADDQADGHGRLPEREEPRMARPVVWL